jgi:predicted porin
MNKNVIALAVAAALAAPLAAQAEVTVSGGLQAEVVNIGGDAASKNGLYAADGGEYTSENGGSFGYLKFSASEDLGNGLTALAVYNMSVNVGDNAGVTVAGAAPGGRDAYVGLSGGFGTVLAGTLTSPYASSTKGWDPMIATFAQARGSFGMSALHNSYAGNALAYANKFGMAKVVAAVVVDEAASTTAADETEGKHGMSFSVNMPVGPVEVAVAYLDATDFGGPNDEATATKVGVKYTAGAITVAAQYEMLGKGLGTSDNGDDVAYITGSYAMGANTFSASYGQTTVKTDGGADVVPTYMMVGMKHAFSKNTSAFVAYRQSTTDTTPNADETALGAGLRVAF